MKTDSTRVQIFCLTLIALFVFTCAEPNPTSSKNEDHSGEVDPMLNPDMGDSAHNSPYFPHPTDWKNPAVHGPVALRVDPTTCLNCHPRNPDPNADQTIPACGSCHPVFPHPKDWAKKEIHGYRVAEFGKSECATACHGHDLAGGLTGVSCKDCHTVFPHGTQWSKPTNHGVTAKGDGKEVCRRCHGADLTGENTGISCYQCHTIFPHPADWWKQENHGFYVSANGKGLCAGQCHGSDLKGGLSDVSCNKCHEVFPHSADWKKEHGPLVRQVGKEMCKGCHGENFDKPVGQRQISCRGCHADYPHDLSTWLPFETGHGKRVQVTHNHSTEECELCHGSDLTNRKRLDRNCFSCHPAYPHKKKAPDGVWRTFEGHGLYTLNQATKTEECKLCHGDDLKGGPRNNPSCNQCHKVYPHPEGWKNPNQHGVAANGEGKNINGCSWAKCHGNQFEGNPPYTPTCYGTCHDDFPHKDPNWVDETNGPNSAHFRVFIRKMQQGKTKACSGCHGANYDRRVGENIRCTNCHTNGVTHRSYEIRLVRQSGNGNRLGTSLGNPLGRGEMFLPELPLFERQTSFFSVWADPNNHGQFFSGHLNAITPDAFCQDCHGDFEIFNDTQQLADLQNSNNGEIAPRCYICHWAYPHKGYDHDNNPATPPKNWEPAVPGNMAHIEYLVNSPFLVDARGHRPTSSNSRIDPQLIPAIANTCGGESPGNCHFNGNRSRPKVRRTDLCGGYCHK